MSTRAIIWGGGAIAALALVLAGVFAAPYVRYRLTVDTMNAPPARAPSTCAGDPEEQVIVALGDSLTAGAVGRSFVDDVRADLPTDRVLINAGVNGDYVSWAHARVDAVIACRPDAVAILLGTNDLLFGAGGEEGLEAYRRDLDTLAARLAETGARLAIFSIPLVGEDPASDYNVRALAYAEAARAVAEERGALYLPLQERQRAILAGLPPYAGPSCVGPEEILREMERGWWLYYSSFRPDWERVAAERGFRLTVDCVHLSALGAEPARELLLAFASGEL